MANEILWALLTAGITGGIWVGIVLTSRHRRMLDEQRQLTERLQQRLDAVEDVQGRLAEVEERLDFTERRLLQEPASRRTLPAD
jgi:predicted nuclease with TOPRIM domain